MILYDFQCKRCKFNYSELLKYANILPGECKNCGYKRPPRVMGKSIVRVSNNRWS